MYESKIHNQGKKNVTIHYNEWTGKNVSHLPNVHSQMTYDSLGKSG